MSNKHLNHFFQNRRLKKKVVFKDNCVPHIKKKRNGSQISLKPLEAALTPQGNSHYGCVTRHLQHSWAIISHVYRTVRTAVILFFSQPALISSFDTFCTNNYR